MRIRIGSVVIGVALAACAWSQEAGTDSKALDGKWVAASAELAGTKLQGLDQNKIELTLADGKYTVKFGPSLDKGTVKVDAAAKPKAMDIVGVDGPNKGRTMLAIYELKDDTLRICYDLKGKERPTEFVSSKEKPFFLVVYQRVK